MKKIFVLDSSALIAFLSNEPGSDIINGYIKKSENLEICLLLHTINCLEIYYKLLNKTNKKKSEEIIDSILRMPITIVEEFNIEILKIAGELKARYKISVADAVAVGLTYINKATLITSDHHELNIIKKNRIIKIQWFR